MFMYMFIWMVDRECKMRPAIINIDSIESLFYP